MMRRMAVVSVLLACWGCGKAVVEVKARPTKNFPRTWDQEVAGAVPGPAEDTPAEPSREPAPELLPVARAKLQAGAVALIVGIERYRKGKLPRAVGAVRDALAFAAHAERSLGVPVERTRVLIDSDATRSSLDAELTEWLPRNANRNGDVYVYFAGHGTPSPEAGDRRAFLLPWDADPNFILQQGIAVEQLIRSLEQLPARRVVVFLDACFTGEGGRSASPEGRPLKLVQLPEVPRQQVFLMTATQADQIAGPGPTGHGLFTEYLLRGLNGAADTSGDGAVTLRELSDFTRDRVRTQARLASRDQTPTLTMPRNAKDTFVLARRRP